jgi:excisionase family DNA binding protein
VVREKIIPVVPSVAVNLDPENMTPAPPLPPKRGLRLKEAAAYSGLTEWFLRRLCWDRKIEFVQSGRAFVILRDDLDKYLESQRYAVRA